VVAVLGHASKLLASSVGIFWSTTVNLLDAICLLDIRGVVYALAVTQKVHESWTCLDHMMRDYGHVIYASETRIIEVHIRVHIQLMSMH